MAELPLTMPKMSMTMEEGTMVAWLKNVGDSVRPGEAIAEVATDKVDMEVESPFEGVIARIVAQPDEVIKVGDPIAWITTDADDLLAGLFDEPEAPAAIAESATVEESATLVTTSVDSSWPAAVPLARAMAASQGVDLSTLTPTGPWGTIRVQDVEGAVAAPAAGAAGASAASGAFGGFSSASVGTSYSVAPPAATPSSLAAPAAPAAAAPTAVPAPSFTPPAPIVALAGSPGASTMAAPAAPAAAAAPAAPATEAAPTAPASAADQWESRRKRTRTQVAKVMSLSAAVPQFTAFVELDLSKLAPIRKTTLGGASWTAILVRAQALALREHSALNGFWVDNAVVPNAEIGIALAVDSPAGLLAPVLRNPDRGTLAELVSELSELINDAKVGDVAVARRSGGTTVFSNLGGLGVESFNALLTPPQATALSTGAVREKVVSLGSGAFGVRLSCTVGLTVDHRVADGADGARYLATLAEIIASQERLLG